MTKHKLHYPFLVMLVGLVLTREVKAITITNLNLGTVSGSTLNVGTFNNQQQVLQATFTINSSSNFTAYTTSYGGGANSNNTTSTNGGFMPSLVLYNNVGNYVAGQTFPSPIGRTDSATGLVGDSYLSRMNLAAGTYILTLSDFLVQQSPTATNLSDGFINYGSGTTFTDVQGNLRTGNYSLNLTTSSGGNSTPSVPEPATLSLVVPALLGMVFIFQKRRKAA